MQAPCTWHEDLFIFYPSPPSFFVETSFFFLLVVRGCFVLFCFGSGFCFYHFCWGWGVRVSRKWRRDKKKSKKSKTSAGVKSWKKQLFCCQRSWITYFLMLAYLTITMMSWQRLTPSFLVEGGEEFWKIPTLINRNWTFIKMLILFNLL